jgi:peptide deformylase
MGDKIVYYGNDILKTIADEVKNINQNIIDLIDNMYNIMYKAKGIGLAGPQVDVSRKIITIDTQNLGKQKFALINPVIVSRSDDLVPYDEGCLSFPGLSLEIMRPSNVTVKAITPDGKEIKIDADDILARVLQHEIDHINGIVFIDHLEDHIRKSLRPDLKKIKKLNREK